MGLQAIVNAIYPPVCTCCGTEVASAGGLCGLCYGEMVFLVSLVCNQCGCPLPGKDTQPVLCDQCLQTTRPWGRGRAVATYDGTARKLVLSLKHGDRPDLARPLAQWLERALIPIAREDWVVVPVPLHRTRMLRRRYNQAAEIARHLARRTGQQYCPDALIRRRATPMGIGANRAERIDHLNGAISLNERRRSDLEGRHILLIDDVMASGATLSACAGALGEVNPASISVGVIARSAPAI